jgi:hypothetical protein
MSWPTRPEKCSEWGLRKRRVDAFIRLAVYETGADAMNDSSVCMEGYSLHLAPGV